MNEGQTEILHYAAGASQGITWYKLHRKYFGTPEFDHIFDDFDSHIQGLVSKGYLTLTKDSSGGDIYHITNEGVKIVSNK